jgi:peptidoglycan/LPS O-acetylase OafA/YrhL
LYAGTDTHADPILIGCLVGILAHAVSLQTWELIRPWLAATAPFLMITLVTITVGFRFSVTVAPAKVALAVFRCPFAIWLGKISYGLYLWHSVSNQYLMTHNLLDFRAGRIAIGLILAVGSYYVIERPFLRNKLGFGELDQKTQQHWVLAGKSARPTEQ